MLRPGELLSDRYRLDAFLASGGMGEVWRATDVVLGRTVAVKVLLPQLLTDSGFAARFRAEARILAAFRHPNVVDVYDFGESAIDDKTALYLVMAYVEGEPLSHRIASDGRLPVVETLSVVAQASDALAAAHSGGVIHRDVKPGNLLVQPDGTVVLVDFGVARSADITAITAANAVPGTVLYMAPEQVSGKPVAATTDIYALGAVAYQCIAGVPPFNGEAPMEIALRHLNDEVPPLPDDTPAPVRDLVMRALAKDPGDRYQSAAEFGQAARSTADAVGGAVPSRVATTQVAPVGQAAVGTPLRTAPGVNGVPSGGGFAPGRATPGGARGDTALYDPSDDPDSFGGTKVGPRSDGARTAGATGAAGIAGGAGAAGIAGGAPPAGAAGTAALAGGGFPAGRAGVTSPGHPDTTDGGGGAGGAGFAGGAGSATSRGPGGPGSRKRKAALAGAGAIVLAGAALAAVVAFTSDDGGTDPQTPTNPVVSSVSTNPTGTATTRPNNTGGNRTPTNPGRTSAPGGGNPGPTATETEEPPASQPATNEPDPGTTGSQGTGGGDGQGGSDDEGTEAGATVPAPQG